jgi:hypothetical protein
MVSPHAVPATIRALCEREQVNTSPHPSHPITPNLTPSLLPPLTNIRFPLLQFLELTYHLPLTLWAIPALLRADPRIPLALLVFGLETSLSTAVCMAEMLSWEELTSEQRGLGGLGGMYGGYLAVGKSLAVRLLI